MLTNLTIQSTGYYSNIKSVKPSINLYTKDKRYDPVVAAGLAALELAIKNKKLNNRNNIAIIGLTDSGCTEHIERVKKGIDINRPRQAYFVRAGAQTIATYAAMALQSHGPTMTLSGLSSNIKYSLLISEQLILYGNVDKSIIIASDLVDDKLIAGTIIVSLKNNNYISPVDIDITNRLSSISLYTIAKDLFHKMKL